MKTSKELDAASTESSITSRLDHKAFLTHITKRSYVKTKKIIRSVDRDNYNWLALLGVEDYTAQSKISIHAEFVAFAFHLYGLPRKLFLYIVFFELNNSTGTFTIDEEMMKRVRGFFSLFGQEDEVNVSLEQASRNLIRKNIMVAIEGNEFMLNPLIAGGSNERKRRKLIDSYCRILEKNGLDTSTHFYPKYQFFK
jgi:hypothetical protein